MSDPLRIGVDLGGTKIEAAALDDAGRIVYRQRIPTPRGDYGATIEAIAALVRNVELEVGAGGSVGIGIPGTPSPLTGRIKNANSTWLNGQLLEADLTTTVGRPVRLANDANCFALSEALDGAARDAPVVFGVILGTGCGGGIVVDGRVLSGPNRLAGEWGHNPLPAPTPDEQPGPPCYCGRTGCLETFLSGPGLSRDHAGLGGGEIAAHDIAARAQAGDPIASRALERYEERLARALTAVINILDPDVIVLGGGLSNIERLYRTVPSLLQPFGGEPPRTRLVPNRHGDSSGVRGAAWLWGRTLDTLST